MKIPVRPELPTASRARVRGLRHARAALDNSAPLPTRLESTYKSGKAVQTNGATSVAPASMEAYRGTLNALNQGSIQSRLTIRYDFPLPGKESYTAMRSAEGTRPVSFSTKPSNCL